MVAIVLKFFVYTALLSMKTGKWNNDKLLVATVLKFFVYTAHSETYELVVRKWVVRKWVP